MKKFFKVLSLLISIIMLLPCGCSGNTVQDDGSADTPPITDVKDSDKIQEQEKPLSREQILASTKFEATVYNTDEIKNAENTTAGSFEAWKNEVFKDSKNNDDPTDNAVITSPFHKLIVNGVSVPVYTARCGTGAHSFAWIDITSSSTQFILELSLTMSIPFEKCVVLPESRNISATIEQTSVFSEISSCGSFTYTFGESADAEVTDPTLAPLTVMVTREEKFTPPDRYDVVEIEPGYHEDNELEFTWPYSVYIVKAGFHDISSISVPSHSILYIERGAYIKVTDRKDFLGNYNTKTAIHADYVEDVKIISRGLLDCGKLQGGDNKYKHVVNTARSKNVSITGLTVINSNTWTICAYGVQGLTVEQNLLLSYRTYSDGIMMSECTDSVGRYNFVRTGDDAIEFKGTGWWDSSQTGSNCIYEYNDLWTDKGAGYCLTWESQKPMDSMVFRNNSIGFAQPTWTSRNTALDCLLGTNPSVSWSNITFENIEIYHVLSPNAINIQVHGNGAKLENILFKNITVKHASPDVFALRIHFSADGGLISNVTVDDYNFCGIKITDEHKSDKALFCNEAPEYFDTITVK